MKEQPVTLFLDENVLRISFYKYNASKTFCYVFSTSFQNISSDRLQYHCNKLWNCSFVHADACPRNLIHILSKMPGKISMFFYAITPWMLLEGNSLFLLGIGKRTIFFVLKPLHFIMSSARSVTSSLKHNSSWRRWAKLQFGKKLLNVFHSKKYKVNLLCSKLVWHYIVHLFTILELL